MAKRAPVPDGAKVFVSRSLADADAQALVQRALGRFDVLETATWMSERPFALAVGEVVADADVAVVLLPARDDPAYANVLFEAGAAVGSGTPVVVVAEGGDATPSLAGLPRAARGDDDLLLRAIAGAYARRRRRRPAGGAAGGSKPPDRAALDPATAIRARDVLKQGPHGPALQVWLASVLRDSGASVVVAESPQDVMRADLTVWHDALQATFGLPLPVEVLARSAGGLSPLLGRLRRLMRESGARSLVAVAPAYEPLNARWTDGAHKILAVDAELLVGALERESLPAALARLLAGAEPAG